MKDFDEGYDRSTVIDGKQVQFTVSRNALGALGPKDRTFRIGGRDFVRRVAVAPEVIAPYFAHIFREEMWSELETPAKYDDLILSMLEPGQEEAWRDVRRSDAEHPITALDLDVLVSWLIAEMSGRPTSPPSASSNGSGGAAEPTPSTEESGLQGVPV